LALAVSNLYEAFFPNTPVITMSSNDSECVKYIANTFLATKVIFFNQMKQLCDTVGANWDSVHDGVVTDSRIGESHSHVPGPDGQCGFGGTCFPKDLNSLIDTMEKNGVDADILKAVWEINKSTREEWDWATNSSAVVQK
jgi:UDPglucose 6-dehydrogenase